MHKYIFQAIEFCKLEQGKKMKIVRMYAAVRQQSHHMKLRSIRLYMRYRFKESSILEEILVTNRFMDARQVLVDDASSPNVQMSHFGVSHLSWRQTHFLPRSDKRRMRELVPVPVKIRFVCLCHSITVDLIAQSKSVKDNQGNWSFRHLLPPPIISRTILAAGLPHRPMLRRYVPLPAILQYFPV